MLVRAEFRRREREATQFPNNGHANATYDPNHNYFESNQFVAIIHLSFPNSGSWWRCCVTAFLHIVRSWAQLFIKTNNRDRQQLDIHRINGKSWQVEAPFCVMVPRLLGRLSSRYVGAPHSLVCWLVHCIATRFKRNRIYQRLLFIARLARPLLARPLLVRPATSSDQSTLIYHSLRITVTKVHIHMICCWHPSSCPFMRWVGLDRIRAENYKANKGSDLLTAPVTCGGARWHVMSGSRRNKIRTRVLSNRKSLKY